MKILLVSPPFYRTVGSHCNTTPIGLSLLCSYLRSKGHEAYIYNADGEPGTEYKSLYAVYKDFDDSSKIFKDRSNPLWTTIADTICAFEPDVVGYSIITSNVTAVNIISEHVSKKSHAVQVVGGPHTTLDCGVSEKLPHIDTCIIGDGEEALMSVINGCTDSVIVGKNTRDLGEYPSPDRTHYWVEPGCVATDISDIDRSYIVTSRNCPHNCTFCASPKLREATGGKVRLNSLENIQKEIEEVSQIIRMSSDIEATGDLKIDSNKSIYFLDDVFTMLGKRAMDIMSMIPPDITWKCEARADRITDELAAKMAETGCVRAKIGVESGSPRILKEISKGETKEDILKGVRLLQKHGVPVTIYLMTGFPGETNEDLQQTIDFAKLLKPDFCSLSILSPYYGSKIFDNEIAIGNRLDKLPLENFFHQSGKLLPSCDISREMLEEFWALSDTSKYA